jgi:hypothetical protein
MPNPASGASTLEKKWKNGILVIIPTRLGLNKVNKEYF